MFSRFKKYFDYASITPIDRGVLKVMNKVLKSHFHNPGSLYDGGVKAEKIMNESRKKVAKLLSCHKDEIIFTSGGTESNNIAIQGVVDAWFEDRDYDYSLIPHVIMTEIEHPSVRNIVENLAKKKRITYSKIKVDDQGLIDIKDFKELLTQNKNTILVSIILVNNEIGVIQNLKEINSIIRKNKDKENNYPLIHVDACQAVNYIDTSLDKMGVDLMSLDSGKFYGPRGAGLLYIKRNTHINPVFFGGDQEFGIRPGTENLPAIVGLAKALDMVVKDREKEVARLSKMQKYIFDEVSKMKNVSINGSLENRVVNNINICFKDKNGGFLDAEFLLFKLDKCGFEVSTGTTCQNKKEDSRSVSVDALGGDCGGSSIRVSLGRYTSWGEVRGLIKAIKKVNK